METRRAETEVETDVSMYESDKPLQIINMSNVGRIRGGCWLDDEKCLAEVDPALIYPGGNNRCYWFKWLYNDVLT